MKKFFKRLKGKVKIGIGAFFLAVVCAVYAIGNIGSEIAYDRPLIKAVIIGDSGAQTDQFQVNNEKIKEIMAQDGFLLGDESYSDGVKNQKDFDENVKPLDNGFTKWHIVRGNHSYYSRHPEKIEPIVKKEKNFFLPTGVIYTNACYLLIESTLWEEIADIKQESDKSNIQDLQKKTISYTEEWLKKCEGKLKIVGAHHCIYAKSGSHLGYNTKEYKALYDKYFAHKVDYFTCGHNHIVEDNGIHEGVHHYTSGAFAKDDTCESENCAESGFLLFDAVNNKVEMVK